MHRDVGAVLKGNSMIAPRFACLAVFALCAAPALAQVYPPPPPDLGPPAALLPPASIRLPPPRQPAPAVLTQSPTGARPGNEIGTGQSLPLSNQSSNITPGDTASVIAPRLPEPPLDENAPPAAFLAAARDALSAGRTGEGQEALERAESRALGRAVRPSLANQPSHQPLVRQITLARDALASGDIPHAIRLIDAALRNPEARAR
jgi:hypothetical protein